MSKNKKKTFPVAPAVLPSGLSAKARQLGLSLFESAPPHMWERLEANAQKALLEEMAKRLGKAPANSLWMEILTPAGQGLSHLLLLTPTQPFLTDTITMTAQACGVVVESVVHPPVGDLRPQVEREETFIYLALEEIDDVTAKRLTKAIEKAMALARAAVADFTPMLAKAQAMLAKQAVKPGHNTLDEESVAFIKWLLDGNFIFLGFRQYRFEESGKKLSITAVPDSGLGILRKGLQTSSVAQRTRVEDVHSSLGRYVADGNWLQLSKTPEKSLVHRPVAMDYVGILERDSNGNLVAEHRFIGLYTSQAYTGGVRSIPLIRRKIEGVLDRSPWSAASDNTRSLVNVLETFPRDELFLVENDELLRLAVAMVQARKQMADITLLARAAPREQAVSVYLMVPLTRYNSNLRERARKLLMKELGGVDSHYNVEMGEIELARVLFKIYTRDLVTKINEEKLSRAVHTLVRGWEDDLRSTLAARFGRVQGQRYWRTYRQALGGAAYREQTDVSVAASDIEDLEAMHQHGENLRVRVRPTPTRLQLRIFSTEEQLPLSQMVPVTRSFGLDVISERPYLLEMPQGKVWLHALNCRLPAKVLPENTLATLGEGLTQSLQGALEIDSLNSLVAKGLSLTAIALLRALAAYMQQADRRFNPGFVRRLLRGEPTFARLLWELFEARHQPDRSEAARKERTRTLTIRARRAIAAMPDAECDRISRILLEVVLASLRTNLWQKDADLPLAIKLDSTAISALPNPRPWREIFVYAPNVEGIHLRGGPVARGGIRHSDRATDYRTEVLGLQTAQMRKNTIIVPVGSKGGFYIKQELPDERTAAGEVIRQRYRDFIRALLSITDTRADIKVVPPRGIVVHDEPDPYLVVAADKGTAHFSDTANEIATTADFWDLPKSYKGKGFWLGDAFASGGVHGYDHKEMGITAKGAWISVAHHLKALAITPSPKRLITVIGIGDMGGDVFGNGLLRSPHVQLIGAFNHKHVFLDPNPDPKQSFKERQRLYGKGLGWDGYDSKKISRGGGVYLRNAKSIALSKEMQKRLGLATAKATPAEIIKALLIAEVDLIWNGGIGTYIKATEESHAEAADRANDEVRVDANEVRAKIIGEGGNLGITAEGRVELALNGVRLNTDALDNSAGVSTSDQEVNLKILFRHAQDKGQLTEKSRLATLPQLTDAIAAAVLHENGLQNMAVTLAEKAGSDDQYDMLSWQKELVARGYIDTDVDNLPSEEKLTQRPQPAYTRPELSVLLAGTKMAMRADIDGELELSAPFYREQLQGYFPPSIHKRFAALIAQHPLADEIIYTQITNMLGDRCGMLMAVRLQTDFACTAPDSLRAVLAAIGLLDAPALWRMLDAEKDKLDFETQVLIMQRLRRTLSTMAGWVLSQGTPVHEQAIRDDLQTACCAAQKTLAGLLPKRAREDVQAWEKEWQRRGLSKAFASRMAALSATGMVPQAVRMAKDYNRPLEQVIKLHLEVGEALMLPAVTQRIRTLPTDTRWTRPAAMAMVHEIMERQARLTESLLACKTDTGTWFAQCGESCRRYRLLVDELLKQEQVSMDTLTVLLARLRALEA